jgi:hypothetical protein
MAKLHSLVRSNSAACVVHDRARQRQVCCGRQRLGRHLGDLAVDLDGGREVGRDEQVAEPLRLCDISLQQVVMNLVPDLP